LRVELPSGEVPFTVLSGQAAEGDEFPVFILPVDRCGPFFPLHSWILGQKEGTVPLSVCLHPCACTYEVGEALEQVA